MIENYHTHTTRCGHAVGTEREYIEAAIRYGIKVLGFSDHAPYPFKDGRSDPAGMRMRPEEFDGYAATLLALKEEYGDRIDIRIGLEAEYYEDTFDAFLNLIRPYPVDYLLLGQHQIFCERYGMWSGIPTDDITRVRQYAAEVNEGIATGKFFCVAHPDLIHYVGSDQKRWEREMCSICETAKAHGVYLELNCLGMVFHKHYPNPAFWKIAGEVGNAVILGADAHEPNWLHPSCLDAAKAFLKQNHLTLTEHVELPRLVL